MLFDLYKKGFISGVAAAAVLYLAIIVSYKVGKDAVKMNKK